MSKKLSIKNELVAAIDMAKDFAPRLLTLLGNSQMWQSPEAMWAGLGTVAAGFAADRVRGIFRDISKSQEIDEILLESPKSKQTLLDLAKFAAQQNPDEETWSAAKKIFINTLKKDVEDRERSSLYEMMNIVKELKGTEIRILASAYGMVSKSRQENHHSVGRWAREIAEDIGLGTPEEVLRYEDNLLRQKLIVPRESLRGDIHETWIGSGSTLNHRLTTLGQNLAKKLAEDEK